MGSIDKACISGFLCRLCSEMHRIVIHIYGDQGQRLCLVEKINGYLPITISPTDPLPKTICTTCLRRVEQHYDLLMRLSRIKEERFVGVNKHRHRFIDLSELSEVSSLEISEDDIYHSDDESRRRRQSQSQQSSSQHASTSASSIFAEPPTSSSSAVVTAATNHSNTSTLNSDEDSAASTSASYLATITQNMADMDDVASTSSNIQTPQTLGNTGDNFELVLPVHID